MQVRGHHWEEGLGLWSIVYMWNCELWSIMIHYPGIVIHPHVFCIVPSLPRWSLLPQHKFQIFTFHLCHSTYASSGSTLQFFCLKPDLIFFKDIILSLCIWRIASWLEAQGWKTPDNFLFSKVWEALKCTSTITEHKHPVVCFHSISLGLWGWGRETENNFVLHQRSRDSV